MNCNQVRDVLAFADPDTSVDRQALQDHLVSCDSCGVDHADVRLLLRAAPTVTRATSRSGASNRRRHWPWIAAAAALLTATVALIGVEAGTEPVGPLASAEGAEHGRIRVLPTGILRETTATLRFRQGRSTVARMEHRTWTPNQRKLSR